MVLTAYFVLSPAIGLFCHRHLVARSLVAAFGAGKSIDKGASNRRSMPSGFAWTRVGEGARIHQFQELGRFAVTYRTIFGKMPHIDAAALADQNNLTSTFLPKSHSGPKAICERSTDR